MRRRVFMANDRKPIVVRTGRRLPRNEVGFALCRVRATGKLASGPVTSGTPNRVGITVACPPGSDFIGLAHTHPGGVAEPSALDKRTAKEHGAAVMCIASDTELACFPTPGRRSRRRR